MNDQTSPADLASSAPDAEKNPPPHKPAAKEITTASAASREAPFAATLAEQTAELLSNTKSPLMVKKFADLLFKTLTTDPDDILPQINPAVVKSFTKILKANLCAFDKPPPVVILVCTSCADALVAILSEKREYITRDLFNEMIDLYNSTNSVYGRGRIVNILGAMTQFTPDFDFVPEETLDIFEKNAARKSNDDEMRMTAIDSILVIGLNCTRMITDNTISTLDRIAAHDPKEYIRDKAKNILLEISDAVRHPTDQPMRRITTALYLKSLELESELFDGLDTFDHQ